MSTVNPRKRPVPESPSHSPVQQQPYMAEDGKTDMVVRWKSPGDGPEHTDPSALAAHQYGFVPPPSRFPETVPTPSNSLTRRPANQALVPTRPRSAFDNGTDQWAGFGHDGGALMPQNPGEGMTVPENVDVLEEMAAKAKREAQSKRKQIPPFVQKLSSFLEERKNEDLIRWSSNGDSFVVLDEDEFAKTLIPELFKHNNYASFVRQLNMYGFHKRVGLSDNSMRASERKNKSPSEYYNPFFRRGHPNLLWLINKPKGGSKAKKGSKHTEGDADSDEDNTHSISHEDVVPQPSGASVPPPTSRPLPAADAQPLHKKDMTLIREELSKVREQQKMILNAINQLQRNNNELYNQALMFQNQHDRHQNSINAILNFLANVFRKTIEDGSSQNVGDIISSLMNNNQGSQQSHPQGSIFDLGDLDSQADPAAAGLGGTHKRARGLLPPIPNQSEQPSRTTSRSPSGTGQAFHPLGGQNPQTGHVTELLDAPEGSPNLRQELETNPHERMMKIINDHNATSSLDFPEAADLVASAPGSLSTDQQGKLVDLMSRQSSTPVSAAPSPSPGPAGQASAAGTSATTPKVGTPSSAPPPPAPPSLSPIMRSPQIAPPSLHQINSNQVDVGHLHRLQSEQDAKIDRLSEMLGPLSPSGRIPGLGDGFFDPSNSGDNMDLYFDDSAFYNDPCVDPADGNDFNFNLDGGGGFVDPLGVGGPLNGVAGSGGGGGVGGNGQNGDVPSPADTEEIHRDDLADAASPDRNIKRRRVG